jgi:hypothetical protein
MKKNKLNNIVICKYKKNFNLFSLIGKGNEVKEKCNIRSILIIIF